MAWLKVMLDMLDMHGRGCRQHIIVRNVGK
jgi:hypothetical protein